MQIRNTFIALWAAALLLAPAAPAMAAQSSNTPKLLELGASAPDFKGLPGVDGKRYALSDFKAPILLVVFLSNHCPFSHAAETRLLPLVREYMPKGVDVIAINPNNPDAIALQELGYSKYNDSFEEMKLYAKEAGFSFPYVYDGDTQITSAAFGVQATPQVFLFDRERKLRYVGRVDDSRFEDPKTVKVHDTRNALDEMLAGKPVTVAKTNAPGCSTKWNSKKDAEVAEFNAKWESGKVEMETIDADGVAALAKNPSNRFRLINVWATWCAPCVEEFPHLVDISRRLSTRKFEFITISMDDPKQGAAALKFLEKHHQRPSDALTAILKKEGRKTTNYHYTGASTDALGKALDEKWDGPLPHTVLIAPGGKIIWRQNGQITEPAKLLDLILKEIGPYYTETERGALH
jgi:thiol-disulfide isomerase/thioredoxin